MASIIPGYEYDIFISYRQKDNKGDRWVTHFVDALKTELEATFKETVSVYFDENPHDRLQETHHVAKSLEAKLKCVIFIPILSQTYCDTSSYAWQFELLPFNKMAAEDSFGKEIKLRGGNYASRRLPIRIHDLEPEGIKLFQQETGSVLRAMDFVFKTAQGVNRPLRAQEDHPGDNLNKTFYRDQVNKVAHAIKEIILGIKSNDQKGLREESGQQIRAERVMDKFNIVKKAKNGNKSWQRILSAFFLVTALSLAGILIYPKLFNGDRLEMLRKKGQVSVAVMPFQNLTRDANRDFWEVMIQDNLINSLSNEKDLKIRQTQTVNALLESHDLTNYASLTPALARSVSQKLDANVFVQGSINQIGAITRLNAKLIDSKTQEVFQSFQLDGHSENIIKLTDSLTLLVKNFLIADLLKKEYSTSLGRVFELSKTPTDPEVFRYYLQGMKLFEKLDLPQAREMYLKALEIDSNFVPALVFLTHSFGGQKMYSEAKIWSKKLYEIRNKVSRVEKMWIEATYAEFHGTPSEAIKYYKMLQDIDDQVAAYYYMIGCYYGELKQYDNAIPALEKNLELLRKKGIKPWSGDYFTLGYAYHKTGQYHKEQKLYKQAEKDFPDNSTLTDFQAMLALTRGKAKMANEYLVKFESLKRKEGASEALIQTHLGLIYEDAGKFTNAEEHHRKALSLEPENPSQINYLAFHLIKYNLNIKEGMELAEKALERQPDNFSFLHTKGLGFFKQGKYPEALETLQKSWDLRREQAIYHHEAFLDLEEAKKAVAKL
jgi:tetratricopeptide (TPR) repeat protein